jgi:two-component system nitrogen regulation response regulator GlnG
VLITGESGAGKELVARAIHERSQRAGAPFIPICIPALSPTLVESELFGHVKGAFTGAERDRRGLLRNADGGTAFFDEIGEVPLLQQVKLLRVLEDRQLTPVGSSRSEPASFRLIAASNRSLEDLVASGAFREDLYYRLRVFPIHVPPLRERREDIPLLAEHFLRQATGGPTLQIADETYGELVRRPWAGNVRELRAAMQYAAVVARGVIVTPNCLPPLSSSVGAARDDVDIRSALRRWADDRVSGVKSGGDGPTLYEQFLNEFESVILDAALDAVGGNRTAAADLLGLHRETLRKRLRKREGSADDAEC